MKKTIVLFSKDLRLHDNPALWEASKQGIVIPVFIYSKEGEHEYEASDASRWWLHHSLQSLEESLLEKGLPLIIRGGNSLDELTDIINETKADAVYFSERLEPSIMRRNTEIIYTLESKQIEVRMFQSHLLLSPNRILNKKNEPYKVFTSFWRRYLEEIIPRPLSIPKDLISLDQEVKSLTIDELRLLPKTRWDQKFLAYWEPGESSAIEKWKQFTENDLENYEVGRDIPSINVVSDLSPHLASGDISVRSLWYSAKTVGEQSPHLTNSIDSFLRQLVWRDYASYLLNHFQAMINTPLREPFKHFPWQGTDEQLLRWKKGQTGYPLVDAGMRQLWETGSMHNRVRMVTASFLIKHLLIDWKKGYDWFKETLVDFDPANNAMGWQWVAGSGIDPSPYYRIFNPITQSEKFDPDGEYIRKWVPELKRLSSSFIHRPWEATNDTLETANVQLGITYPYPIVDHVTARKRALESFDHIKKN